MLRRSIAFLQPLRAVDCHNGLSKALPPCEITTRLACTTSLQRGAADCYSLRWNQQGRNFSSSASWHRSSSSSWQDRARNRNDTDNTSYPKTNTSTSGTLAFLTRILKISLTLFVVGHFATYIVIVKGTWGPSMIPTFSWSTEAAIISVYFHRRGRNIAVGDLISFENPVRPGYRSIKRVIGMPGDIVCRDTPGKGEGWLVQVPEGHCWVTGDNLDASRDSRQLGPIPLALVRGKVIGKLSPWPQLFKNGLVDAEDVEEWQGKEEEDEENGLYATIKNQLVRSA